MTESTRGLDLDGLSAFLESRGIAIVGDLSAQLLAGGRSNLTFRVQDDVHRWVLRRPPLGEIERGAHEVSREYVVMRALAGSNVPVPRTVALCDEPDYLGVPFYVMEEVEGDVLRTRELVGALDPSERARVARALVDALADLHDIRPADIGLETFGRPAGYLTRQLDRWQRQYHHIAVRELPAVDAISTILRESMPASPPATIVHGDYRIDNVIVDATDRGRIAAVLDWEMATLGDPLADLATLTMFWDEPGAPFNPITGGLTAFEGFPSKAAIVEAYARRRDVDLSTFGWYLCFAELKLAVILEQIHARHLAGQTLGEGFAGIDRMVDQLLASAGDKATTLTTVRSPA